MTGNEISDANSCGVFAGRKLTRVKADTGITAWADVKRTADAENPSIWRVPCTGVPKQARTAKPRSSMFVNKTLGRSLAVAYIDASSTSTNTGNDGRRLRQQSINSLTAYLVDSGFSEKLM